MPGLVSSLAEGRTADIGLSNPALGFIPAFGVPTGETGSGGVGGNVVGRTHRMLVPPNSFKIETLALPALKFLERAKESVPEVDTPSAAALGRVLDPATSELARRCSGLMDEQTLERLRPALSEQLNLTLDSSSARVNGSATNGGGNVTEMAMTT